jgi:uncharacterized protein (TIGR02118 family)
MIRVSVLYASKEGAKFDHEYYASKHIPLVQERLTPLGMVRAEIDKGLPGPDGSAPPFVGAVHMFFNSLEDFQKGLGQHAGEIMGDIPNYTDLQPQIQISETTAS